MNTVFLSLGSSLEFKNISSEKILKLASEEIKNWEILQNAKNFKISQVIQSNPWGGVAKNIFYNSVIRIDILENISPEKILEKIQAIEKKFGRTRNIHWGDRTLDIDIIFFGSEKISTKNLTVPHPLWKQRDFVVTPLRQICTEEEFISLSNI